MSKLERIFLIIIIIILVAFCVVCFLYLNIKNKYEKIIENNLTVEHSIDYSEKGKIMNTSSDIVQESISSKGLSIVITDNNSKKLDWSTGYKIRVLNGNEWQDIEMITKNVQYIPINYEFDENNQAKLELEWTDYYGKLEKGKYHIQMYVLDTDEQYPTIYHTKEFEIK